MLHLAVLSPSLLPSAEPGRALMACGGALAQRGWRVDFLACEADAAPIAAMGARLVTLPEAAADDTADADYLELAWRELFRDGLPDVVIDAGWPSLAAASAVNGFAAPLVRLAELALGDPAGLEGRLAAVVEERRRATAARALVLDVTRASVGGAADLGFEATLVRRLHEIERTLLVSWDDRLDDYRLLFADEAARLQVACGPLVAARLSPADQCVSLGRALAAEGLGLSDVACLLVAPLIDARAAKVGRWFADRRTPYAAILRRETAAGLRDRGEGAADPACLRLLRGAHRLIAASDAAAGVWRALDSGEGGAVVVETPPLSLPPPSSSTGAPVTADGRLARAIALRQVRSWRDYALACRVHAMAGRLPPDEDVPSLVEPVTPVQTFLKPSGLEWEELLYPGKPPGDWQMSDAERMALTGLLARWRPKTYLEIGTFYGGSALLAAQFAEWVITIDIDPYAETRFVKPANVSFIAGRSQDMAADLLDDLAARDQHPDFILIDGDHSAEGVRRDLNIFLQRRPQRPTVIVMHDSFNPGCREGMRTADWAGCPWVRRVELDFVPGRVVNVEDNPFKGEMWGGLAVAVLTPEANPNGAMIFASAQDGFDEAVAHAQSRAA